MKSLKCIYWIVSVAVALFVIVSSTFAEGKKVTICHYPPGNIEYPQTISISENSLPAHLKHGDQVGECPSGCELNPSLCNDGNVCTFDVCLADGSCEHNPINCDDSNPCTSDFCDIAFGCVNTPSNGLLCDDGNVCTGNDVCINAECIGQPIMGCCLNSVDCEDGNLCTTDVCLENSCFNEPIDCTVTNKCLVGFCDPSIGECTTTPVTCDDSNICTDDFCDFAIGCYSLPTTSPPEGQEVSCNDGEDNDCDGMTDGADDDCVECPISAGEWDDITIVFDAFDASTECASTYTDSFWIMCTPEPVSYYEISIYWRAYEDDEVGTRGGFHMIYDNNWITIEIFNIMDDVWYPSQCVDLYYFPHGPDAFILISNIDEYYACVDELVQSEFWNRWCE